MNELDEFSVPPEPKPPTPLGPLTLFLPAPDDVVLLEGCLLGIGETPLDAAGVFVKDGGCEEEVVPWASEASCTGSSIEMSRRLRGRMAEVLLVRLLAFIASI